MWKVCWNKGRLCWKIVKLFYFCHLKKLVRPETFGPYYVHTHVYIMPIPHLLLHTTLIRRTSGRRSRTLNFTLLRTWAQHWTENHFHIMCHFTRHQNKIFRGFSFPEKVLGFYPNYTYPWLPVMYLRPCPATRPSPPAHNHQQPKTNFKISSLVQPSKLYHLFITEQPQHKIQPKTQLLFPAACPNDSLRINSPSSNPKALPGFQYNFFTTRTIGHKLRTFRGVKFLHPRNKKN